MNADYHSTLQVDQVRTFDDYLRERIRRGLQAHHDYIELLTHMQDPFRDVYRRYILDLAQRDGPER